MGDQWRLDNNGTGETLSIYEGNRLVADVYDDVAGRQIIRDHNAARATDRAAELEALISRLRAAWESACEMVYEHHSAGVMDGIVAGQECPVCTNPRLAATKDRMNAALSGSSAAPEREGE
jgi:ribonuclease HI